MHRSRTPRPARCRLAIAATSILFTAGAIALAIPSAGATAHGARPAAAGTPVTVRVEGPHGTLLPRATVVLHSGTVTKDGVTADSCSGLSAAGALELATDGKWVGTWSKSLKGYFVSAIDGVSFPSTGAEFWAFWLDDAPASQGICGLDPKPGQRILFFPDCYGKSCPKSAGVLGVAAPKTARAGMPFRVTVTAYADSNGKPSPAAGATVSGGGTSATTGAGGTARLTVAHGGRIRLTVSKPHAIRTEATLCVESAAMADCG